MCSAAGPLGKTGGYSAWRSASGWKPRCGLVGDREDHEKRLPTPFPPPHGEISEVLRWITVTHTQRWHAHHHTAGTGPVYQGRFKSFPVQTDEHFLTVARYVERNALRAKLVGRIKGVGSLFLTRVSGIDTRAVCPAAPALQLEILRIMS